MAARKTMRANLSKDTAPERRLRSALFARGLRYRKHALLQADGVKVRADIVFPRQRVVVFMDGCFWHGCPEHGSTPSAHSDYWIPKLKRNKERDEEVNAALREAGWMVIRVWEHEQPVEAASRIAAVVAERRRSHTPPERSDV